MAEQFWILNPFALTYRLRVNPARTQNFTGPPGNAGIMPALPRSVMPPPHRVDREQPKQPFTDGAGEFPGFDLAFAQRGAGSGGVRFGPKQALAAILVEQLS